MVGVSDDVNEYAMALRDTEDKLRRCPKRVRWAGRWDLGRASCGRGRLTGWGSPGQPTRETCSLPWGLSSSSPVSTPALAGPQQ